MTELAAAVLAVLAICSRIWEDSWLTPGTVYSAYWTVWLAAVVAFGGDYPVPAVGPWFIVASAVAVVCGCQLRRARENGAMRNDRPTRVVTVTSLPLLYSSGIVGGVAGIAAAALTVGQSGYSLTEITNQSALLQIGNAVSVQRYSATPPEGSGVVALMLAVSYAGALAAPFLLTIPRRARPRGWRLVMLFPAASVGVYSVVTTARLPMLLTVSFTVLSMVAATHLQGRPPRVRAVHVVTGAAVAGALAFGFILIAFVRVGSTNSSASAPVYDAARVYAVGGVSGFAQWLTGRASVEESGHSNPGLTLGAGTFGAPARQLDVDRPPQSSKSYQAYVTLDTRTNDVTNIYTAFRSAIEDFGAPGALVFFCGLGYLTTAAQGRAVARADPLAALVWTAGYAYILNMNSQSIFWFTNVWAGFVLAAICIVAALRSRVPLPAATLTSA